MAALKPAAVDLAPLSSRLDALDARVAGIKLPAPAAVDLGPLIARLGALESHLADQSKSASSLFVERLSVLEQRVSSVHIERVDLGPLVARIAALEALVLQAAARDAARASETSARTLVAAHHRVGGGRNLLTRPGFGEPDERLRIVGVGPVLLKLLHELGVYYFWQIADWSEADVRFVDSKLEAFKGRIEREHWVDQSREFAALPTSAKRPLVSSAG